MWVIKKNVKIAQVTIPVIAHFPLDKYFSVVLLLPRLAEDLASPNHPLVRVLVHCEGEAFLHGLNFGVRFGY